MSKSDSPTSSDSRRWLLVLLRTAAVAIAVAALVDPAIESLRRTRPVVAVVVADSVRDAPFANEVVERAHKNFQVVRGALPSAAATVVIGAELPPYASTIGAPALVVHSRATDDAIVLRRLDVPERTSLDARATVSAVFQTSPRTTGGAGDSLTVELSQSGTLVSRARVADVDARVTAALDFIPTRAGPTVLQLRAYRSGGADTLRHDVLIRVDSARWSVLFFDRRPSWMSTFVRRALEDDARFAVSNRIITSTNISRETGRPPQALQELAASAAFDVIVVGAPESLTPQDVLALSALLRERGASVVVLADHATSGSINGLLNIGRWNVTSRNAPLVIAGTPEYFGAADSLLLRATSVGSPAQLPPDATVMAVLRDGATAVRPVIWQAPRGLGTLFVSGAFDAWRFRDAEQSTFNASWRDIIDDAASRRVAPLALQITPSLVTPRAEVHAVATLRTSPAAEQPVEGMIVSANSGVSDGASGRTPDSASASASESANDRTTDSVKGGAHVPFASLSVQLTDAPAPDQRSATFRAPATPGTYFIRVAVNGDTVQQPLVVATAVARDGNAHRDLLAVWSASRGGRVIPREAADSLTDILESMVQATPRSTRWHPMRSAWWIVPFALLLSAEWWLRRRRGMS